MLTVISSVTPSHTKRIHIGMHNYTTTTPNTHMHQAVPNYNMYIWTHNPWANVLINVEHYLPTKPHEPHIRNALVNTLYKSKDKFDSPLQQTSLVLQHQLETPLHNHTCTWQQATPTNTL